MARELEEEVGEFFDIESDLQNLTEAGVATPDVTDVDSGLVMAIDRVSTTVVPDEYPISMTGEQALAIEVELDTGRDTTVFVDWPDDGNDVEQIEQLLDAADVSFDSFADIYGKPIPLEVHDGYLVAPVHTESEPSVDDSRSELSVDNSSSEDNSPGWIGMVLCSGLWTWAAVELTFGDGLTWIGWLSWAIVAFFLIGWAEMDRQWIAQTTNWTPQKKWTLAILLFPPASLPVYLSKRFDAR